MKNKDLRQFLLVLGCAILSISLCLFTVVRNNFEITKDSVQSMLSLKELAKNVVSIFTNGSTTLFDLGKAILAFIFILLLPGLFSFASIVFQGISYLFKLGKERQCKQMFHKGFAIAAFSMISSACIPLLFSFICGFGCSRILILLILGLNLTCMILLIKPTRVKMKLEEDEQEWPSMKGEKERNRKKEQKKHISTVYFFRIHKVESIQKEKKNGQNEKEKEEPIVEEINRDYYCPTCGELLVPLIQGGQILHCVKCGGIYGKDDYMLRGKE